jgi:ribosomal protein L19E
MGHKDWNTTSKYIHLARILELIDEDENYIVKTAETIEQAKELLENGFAYVQDLKGISIYRKRK